MKKTRLLSLVLAFLLILTSSVWVFAEETQPVNLMTEEMITLRDNIADVIKDVEDGWTAMDMAAYATIPDTTIRMSDVTKQKIVNLCIQQAQAENVSASDQARIEIVLKSIGIDSSELYSLNSDTPFDNGTALKNANHTANGHYAAPWILIADTLGNVNLSEEQKTALIDVLNTNSSEGTFGYEWEGVSYPDYDTAATVLAAVAPVYSTNDTAKTMADEIILSLESNIAESGSLGSANTDAMVIIGYIAMGKNPADLKHPVSEKTVVDGLMSYVNESNNGFTFYGAENYLATEQGFRALVALSGFSGPAYNIYDFSENVTVAGRETSDQEEGEILPPTEEETQPVNLMTEEMITLRDNIADVIKDVEDGWTAMDMAAYATIPDTTIRMSDVTKQKIVNLCIQQAQAENVSASDQARIEIVLKSIGIDSSELYSLNSDTPFDNGTALKNANHTANGHYAAPWILIADTLGNVNLTDEQKTNLIDVLNTNSSNGTFGYEWEGVSYPDYDTAAVVLAAVAPVYSTNDTAKTMADEIILSLESNIAENGSLGSANTDAMVIIGYIAMGKNPEDLKHPVSEKTVVDGLMSYVNESNNGFTFYGAENYLATEQGFRALVALSGFSGPAYNIYDFSENVTVAGRETSDQEEGEILPPTEEENTFTVMLTVEAKDEKWIDNVSVTVEEGATVYDAFVKAISDAGMSQTGAEDGYVRSITKDNITLSEFGSGKNSGWLYKVNGVKASVGLKSHTIYENDEIVWYYVEDWKTSGGITNGYGGGLGGTVKEDEEETEEVPEETPDEIPVKTFSDTDNHWANEAISYVVAEGIMQGMSEDEFAPDEKLTRAMLVTMLYRLSGDASEESYSEFTDVSADAWYTDAVNWAVKAGITDGMGDGTFGADVPVTREQLALFLMRYAENCGENTTVDEVTDDSEISQWAQKAVSWANKTGLISGYDDGSLYPKNSATRAEIATVFMRYIENIIK